MPYTAAFSTSPDTTQALDEVTAGVQTKLGTNADLALAFFSPHHASQAAELSEQLQQRLGAAVVLGCQGESIVANDREIENSPALVLWLARWAKQVELMPFHLTLEETPEGHSLMGWPDALEHADPHTSAMLMLGDPFSFPTDQFLNQVNENHKGLRVMGGMSSGAQAPGQTSLMIGGNLATSGAVGVLLQGDLGLRSVVSQGCRPIGKHMVITQAQDNLILELGGKPALVQLQELWQTLPAHEQELVRRGLHIGRVLTEYKDEFHRGDFLVRNVIGFDRGSGAIAVTERVRVGQTVQFHVRDAATADEDLHELLQIDMSAHDKKPSGGLLFTCNGRGSRLFDAPHHDARVLREEAGQIPVAGFFAQGELGPVGGMNSIHCFTASVVLFEE